MQPLVFIDTNIFLDFYRSGKAGISLLQRIDGVHKHLLTTDQVEVEFLNNRQRVIRDSLVQLKAPAAQIVIPAYLRESRTASAIDKSVKNIRDRISALRRKFEKLLANPSTHDPVFKVVRNLMSDRSVLNLKWNASAQDRILRNAQRRFLRGYPPRKRGDTSLGDAINWEWIIDCASRNQRDVVIVSRDEDYGLFFDSRHYLNDLLFHEFRKRAGARRKISFTNSLTEALKKLSVSVPRAEEKDEVKVIAESRPNVNTVVDDVWTSNRLNCTETWGFLFDYEELNVPFSTARNVKMSELAFYNPAASGGRLADQAGFCSTRLDLDFRKKSGAVFKKGWTVLRAVNSMKEILVERDKLVWELAERVREIYSFTGDPA